MEEYKYKNFYISGGGLPDWPKSTKWRPFGRVFKIGPGGRTIVIQRVQNEQMFSEREDAEAHTLKLAKEWVNWAEEARAWLRISIECFGESALR